MNVCGQRMVLNIKGSNPRINLVGSVRIGALLSLRDECLQRIRTTVATQTTTRNHGASSLVGTTIGTVIFPCVVSEICPDCPWSLYVGLFTV